jgi:AraC-like DNA-binding protein
MARRERLVEFAVGPGTILVVPRGEVIAMKSLDGAPCRVKSLLIGEKHIADPSGAIVPRIIEDATVITEMVALFRELEAPVRSIDVVQRLAGLLARASGGGRTSDHGRTQPGTPLDPVRDYLRAHMDGLVATADLERFSGLTRFHLARVFHRAFGLAPRGYQLRQRLALAARQLAQGVPCSEVAYQFGFSDQSHLTRVFKVTYGVTPYRWSRVFSKSEPRCPSSLAHHPIGLCIPPRAMCSH